MVDGDEVAELTGTEMLSLAKSMRGFVLENADSFDNCPRRKIEVNQYNFWVAVTDFLPFWESLERNAWEPETFAIFDKFIHSDTVFLDVGGWIGSTALYGAQLSKKTYVFEPDPIAFKELKRNLHLNSDADWHSRVRLENAAISHENGELNLGAHGDGGDSMSSALLSDDEDSWRVKAVELLDYAKRENLIGEDVFCKIDIEGFEYDLAPSFAAFVESFPKARVFLSLHPQFLIREINRTHKGILSKRLAFYKSHKKLLAAFKNHRLEHVNGKSFNLRKEMIKALVTGDFPKGIVILPA